MSYALAVAAAHHHHTNGGMFAMGLLIIAIALFLPSKK
jgi:hypothetical protein